MDRSWDQTCERWKRIISRGGYVIRNHLRIVTLGSESGYALKSIDKEVARELAKWKGKYLNLQGLESIDKETAQELVKIEGVRLSLTGLGFIDKDTLEILKSNRAIRLPSK